MRKADLATEVFERIGVSKKEAAEMIEIILDMIKGSLQKGESVKIAGFGNFIVRSKQSRKGRNPKTGEEIGITPRRVVTFRPSQVFKKYVNHAGTARPARTETAAGGMGGTSPGKP
jgi:integration host factor subunit alpha